MELSVFEFSITGFFLLCALIQLYFSFFIHLKLARYRVPDIATEDEKQECQPLSVIICARNEVSNLGKYLPAVLEQDYPDFEVIVVNDRSWDGTADLLEVFAKRYNRLKVVSVSEGSKFIAGKKFAVTMGIKAASHNWLVFTDADCMPASPNWLKGMSQPASADTAILLGYSPYFKRKSLLNLIIRMETFTTAVNYLSFALSGNPYMGVGRNLAYHKDLFFKNKGFAAHIHIASGDDDLFVNANANSRNTAISIAPEAQVWSEPKMSFMAYIRQKKRHFSAGMHYKAAHRRVLALQYILPFMYYISGVTCLFFEQTRIIALAVFAVGILLRALVYPRLFRKLSYPELRWWFPFLELIVLLFQCCSGFISLFIRKIEWK